MRNFEVLDARIASALNKVIHNSHFKRRISLEEQKGSETGPFPSPTDRLLTWSTNTSGSQEPMILSRIMPTYSLLVFEKTIFRNSIQRGTEFYCQWRKSHLMTSWKRIVQKRIRESEKLKTVLELCDLEIHQKKIGPDYHRLKTMVKRSIEQDIRNRNVGTRNGNYERNAVVKNPGKNSVTQRILGDCWWWKTNGQCSRGDNCSFRHDINSHVEEEWSARKRYGNLLSTVTKVTTDRGDPRSSVTHPSWVESRTCWVQIIEYTTNGLCFSRHEAAPKPILRKSSDMQKPIQRVEFTKAIARFTKIRDQNLSLGMICPGEPHQRSSNAPKFEDRSREERVARVRCPRSSVEVGQKCVKIKGARQSNILLVSGK